MTASEFARRIDHTLLKPEAATADIDRIVREAIEHRFAAVCVAPVWIARVATALKGSGVLPCAVVSFPHGTSKPTLKAIESTSSIKDGAAEVDVVAHLPYLASLNLDAARSELLEIVRASRATRREVVVKVIVETAYLMSLGAEQGEAAIEVACRAVRESGCDFIKTSTGFHPAGGASVEAVKLMKKYGEGLKVKASGGIRDLPTALVMLEAGADRLGLSASVQILAELART
jgi:deoxyribose-phosphate aldolase